MLTIRPETAADDAAVYEVNKLAFDNRDAEPQLVAALRGLPGTISLVAELDGQIVGHILFSQLQIQTPAETVSALSLAPLAVRPGFQNRGIGSALTRCGLDECKARGHKIVIVLGHAGYYPRFGFSAVLAEPLDGPWGGGEHWMALELVPGALDGVRGKVIFPKAFDSM
ncbi:MAG: GNAT family N-acetyltransferase [Chloroflexota bacterium]